MKDLKNISVEEKATLEASKNKPIEIKCNCPCHKPGMGKMLHFAPCCEHTYLKKS